MKNVNVSNTTLEQILKSIEELKKEVRQIKAKIGNGAEPPYGSDEWWELSDKQGIEDYKDGRYITFKNAKELQAYLDSLK